MIFIVQYSMDYESKLEELLLLVRTTKDMRARSQLFKMYANCKAVHTEMSKELVECRRYQKVTHKYTELEQKLQENITNFEQWAMFAALLYWLDPKWVVCYNTSMFKVIANNNETNFNTLNLAMAYAKTLNVFVTIKGSEFEIVGMFGVDSVKDGKCPDGVAYDWNKASRIGRVKKERM